MQETVGLQPEDTETTLIFCWKRTGFHLSNLPFHTSDTAVYLLVVS